MIAALNDAYIFPETAKKMEKGLRQNEKKGRYEAITSAQAFAETLTVDIQSISKDLHLRVGYSHEPIPVREEMEQPTPEEIERDRAFWLPLSGGGPGSPERPLLPPHGRDHPVLDAALCARHALPRAGGLRPDERPHGFGGVRRPRSSATT
jgi:hypothetical protein